MSNLIQLKRPPISFIKAVEAIGILLGIPQSDKKSIYKAPVPSNYDKTVELLNDDFYGIINNLSALHSDGIPNDIASSLFTKILEPGFDYEEAMGLVGLEARELFNLLILLIQQMQNDNFRIPIKTKDVLLIFDGSLASYVALDCLSHVHNHGNFTILSIKDTSRNEPNYHILADHNTTDLLRRCENQYKKPTHQFQIIDVNQNIQENLNISQKLFKYIEESDADIIIFGLDPTKYVDDELSLFTKSLPDSAKKSIIIAKSSSRVLPFDSIIMPRTFLLCVKAIEDLNHIFFKSTQLMRPIDSMCVLCIHESRSPKGDYQELRFSFGNTRAWVKGETKPSPKFNKYGWNYMDLQQMRVSVSELLSSGQISGQVLMEEESETNTVTQIIGRVAAQERADFVVVRKGVDREVSFACIEECLCSVVLIE